MKTLALCVCMLVPMTSASSQGYKPSSGYVPDSVTAVRIAEAVLIPVYGQKQIESEEPFTAKLEGDVWTVEGTLRCSDGKGGTTASCVGGAAEVRLSKADARILYMVHWK